ncbi:hypothetical protein BDV25DRAFT_159997 [Aspergillus avenaceus]|uniref:Uncharacterized protein n=1 Tax=Aspergillus avenaceus TaxID=36643 RepID=A0A5N6TNC5_ASPAV|nr:hypothetical protein BDV25DRAFT_159997 [Aspergillus avenaceus]
MVALRRLFHAGKSPSAQPDNVTHTSNTSECDQPSGIKTLQSLEADHSYQRIERQFEAMHEQLQARPLSARSQIPPSRASSRTTTTTTRNARHVDLLEALFSSHRYHIQSAQTLSPISPYNEDIAERNMTRFLQGQSGKKNMYSRILSTLYQEDVADRNIAKSRRGNRPVSRTRMARSRGASFQGTDEVRCRPQSKASDKLTPSPSQESLESMPVAHTDSLLSPRQAYSPLRPRRSVPNFPTEGTGAPDSRSNGHLGVPPAHKQGNTWSNTPIPDSPTLPAAVTDTKHVDKQDVHTKPSSLSRNRSATTSSLSPTSNSTRPRSKRNVRDLSIDTELAVRGKSSQSPKIAHRAIQPPTPSSAVEKQNPTIAEVMHSPLPAGSPATPSPMYESDQKIAEIMDMFKQACTSSQALSPHPTYETLQDAIIREINSHEAFQRVSVPLTPSPFKASFDRGENIPRIETPGSKKHMSLKEGQFSKFSFRKHRRGSDMRKSISTSVPSSIFRRASETTRRRHTDAPPPSPGFFNTLEHQAPLPEEQVTYMDCLLKSRKSPSGTRQREIPDISYPQSTCPTSPAGFSVFSQQAPSVCHMRAQASPVSIPPSFSADDSDEEVIELPSVDIPALQIQGIDENNVTYIAENTTPRSAYRLMSWPQQSGRSVNLRGNTTLSQTSSGEGPKTCSVTSY